MWEIVVPSILALIGAIGLFIVKRTLSLLDKKIDHLEVETKNDRIKKFEDWDGELDILKKVIFDLQKADLLKGQSIMEVIKDYDKIDSTISTLNKNLHENQITLAKLEQAMEKNNERMELTIEKNNKILERILDRGFKTR
jgi:predicted  nucleic acid-binding Zn-ribbon protein